MSLSTLLNGGRKQTVREGIDTKDIPYMSAADFAATNPEFPVSLAGFFIKNGDYGEQVTIIVMNGEDPTGLNIPKRYVDDFKDMDQDDIDAVINGELAIESIETNVKTPKGKTTMINFIRV